MPTHPRMLWRIAQQLERHYQVQFRRSIAPWPPLLMQEVDRAHQRWGLARSANLPHAARECQRAWEAGLRRLAADLMHAASQQDRPVPTLRHLYDELRALDDEFEQVVFDLRARTIVVVTERIELEGIDLGPFDIDLSFCDPHRSMAYHVIPRAANPAASDDDVPHPHVRGQTLCEGDARDPMQHALKEGRLLDFFILVRQVLRTYNATSAYRSLNDWFGCDCERCGTTMHEDERYSCDCCGAEQCADCSAYCPGCSSSLCSECEFLCGGCELTHCRSCLSRCVDCEELQCRECLVDSRCSDCQPSDEEPLHDQSEELLVATPVCPPSPPETRTPETDAEIQPDRLGEVAVSA